MLRYLKFRGALYQRVADFPGPYALDSSLEALVPPALIKETEKYLAKNVWSPGLSKLFIEVARTLWKRLKFDASTNQAMAFFQDALTSFRINELGRDQVMQRYLEQAQQALQQKTGTVPALLEGTDFESILDLMVPRAEITAVRAALSPEVAELFIQVARELWRRLKVDRPLKEGLKLFLQFMQDREDNLPFDRPAARRDLVKMARLLGVQSTFEF
jgi:hypothetical protein